MTDQLVWLASYPKSGNTWLRAILTALSMGSEEMLDINSMVGGAGPISPNIFEDVMGVCWSELTIDERRHLLPDFTTELARETRGMGYHKTHMSFGFSPSGKPIFHNREGSVAVYIVRDPRQVAISHAHFFGTDIDQAIATMNDPARRVAMGDPGITENVGRWTDHVTGWIAQDHIPIHVMRYEMMKSDPFRAIKEMLEFVGVSVPSKTIETAIAATRFDRLQKLEREHGFKGRSFATDKFFRNGASDEWRQVLTADQKRRLEQEQQEGMRMLGYLTESPAATRKSRSNAG